MEKLKREDLFSLEEYAQRRPEFRKEVMEHKRNRQVPLGEHVRLYFEDRLIIQYQVQEMLRAERIFEQAAIEEELESYNPLIPDGSNWKATFMVEYPEAEERKQMLAKLIGIEDQTWVQVKGFDKVVPIADEDLERDTEEKTSSVHFLRFELSPEMVKAVKDGAEIAMGVEHEHYQAVLDPVPPNIREALAADLD